MSAISTTTAKIKSRRVILIIISLLIR